MKGDRDEGGGFGKQGGGGGSCVKNQHKEGGEGLDVLQGGGLRPHLDPPLRHHLHSLHLPGSQRVTIRLSELFFSDSTSCSNVPILICSSLQRRHDVLLCNHNLCRVGASTNKRGNSFPSNFVSIFLSCYSNPYEAGLSFFWQVCNSLQFFLRIYGFFADQATIFCCGSTMQKIFLWMFCLPGNNHSWLPSLSHCHAAC